MIPLTFIFIFIFGLIIGSFLNACIWRLRVGKSVLRGRSVCTFCDHILRWNDLIPLVSFLFLKGVCRYCKKPISLQYPFVEAITGALFVLSYVAHNGVWQLIIRDWIFVSILIVIFVYDLLWEQIRDWVTLPSILVALLLNLYLGVHWTSFGLASMIGGGLFLIQYVLSKGVWIGDGDIRLGFCMGIMVGFPGILLALFMAYCVGACVGLTLIFLQKKEMKSSLPFGPFLAGATIIVLLYGEPILTFLKPYYAL